MFKVSVAVITVRSIIIVVKMATTLLPEQGASKYISYSKGVQDLPSRGTPDTG